MATTQENRTCEEWRKSRTLCEKDDLRASFALAMSVMYRQEVPLYGDLVEITRRVNRHVAESEDFVASERLDIERHGAIRLGTPLEVKTIRRIFSLMGMYPVDYYDLSVAGLPMHGTAFRPIEPAALRKNPFRVFTTLLRPELLNVEARRLALSLLQKRTIFSDKLLELLDIGESQGFTGAQGEEFILEALKTFQWQEVASATHEEYLSLQREHTILADITCFSAAHINHLTPRVLDIELAERQMKVAKLQVKDRIEGPPFRKHPILLRQTSFLALQEEVRFPTKAGLVQGFHKARFGEIEQRGAAVTARGRLLYDTALQKAIQESRISKDTEAAYAEAFKAFPDDLGTLLSRGLIYCTFRCTSRQAEGVDIQDMSSYTLSSLLMAGTIEAVPITYEDFLPFSAAGIFQSNLKEKASGEDDVCFEAFEDQGGLEAALGCSIIESGSLYRAEQDASLKNCAKGLGLTQIIVDFEL